MSTLEAFDRIDDVGSLNVPGSTQVVDTVGDKSGQVENELFPGWKPQAVKRGNFWNK
jgi:hypothetical protein